MECFTAIATGAVSKLGELAVDLTVKQFKYMIQQDKIIANLKEEHKKLKAKKAKLQGIVDGLEDKAEVQDWLCKVEGVDNELERFFANEANKNNKCFGGKCPNLAVNYSLGKRATKKAQDIASLKEQESNFKLIPCPKSPPRLGSLITQDIKALESRKAILKDVVEKLKDERLKRISICGMGGVGKTTLVDEVIQNVETSKLFDRVAKAAVSQKPDYEKIQIEIADRLQLEFRGKSMQERALELHERVNGENKRVLIVLDDVWDELDFRCIGLPSLENQKGCKILFTSREAKACQKMGSQEIIVVPVLSDDEAWCLFREMAGDVVDEPHIDHIAKEVAKECGGLPLALVTVARALGNEEQPAWETALVQLKTSPSTSFSDVQKLVYSRIEHSVNFLSNAEQKCCLMLCGLFPEDFDIPIESLLRLGMGMGMFKVDGALRKTRNLVHTLIGHLKKCFLLLDSVNPDCVKMHDVVRDVVISIASKAQYGFMIQYNAELKSPKEGNLDHVKAISLILDETKGLENALSEHPTLQLLQVRSKSKEQNPWPEHFFQGMKKLEVLALENLSIPTLPSFFQASTNLHTLQVQYCNVGDISVIGKELKKLEVLSFAHSNIKEIPIEIGELVCLKLLDLTGCDDLFFISTNVFRRLLQLQELYFGVKNFPWMRHEDVLMELQSLSSNHLKVVELTVRKVETFPKDLTFKNLEKFWVCIGPYSKYERRGYLESNTVEVGAVNYKSIKCSLMINELFKKCEILILRLVEGLKNVICELDDSERPFSCLKGLRIDSCHNLEYVFDGTGPYTSFPQIQSLSLDGLGNLREICNVTDHYDKELTIKFLNLVELKLQWLPCLTGFSKAIDMATQSVEMVGKLFSTKWMHQFPKLETLSLSLCDSLEMIFDLQGNSQLNDQSNAVLFPQLKHIDISFLGKLTHVWGNAPNNVQGFQNLRSMSITSCGSLKHAFTPAIVRAITKLEKLEVRYCELMENLVDDSRDEEQGDHKEKGKVKITFDRLDSLTLWELPNIASICPKSYELELPSIRELDIDECPKLNISSLLNEACTKQNNVIVTSDFDNSKEKHSSSAHWHFGCAPFCSKLIRPANKNKKSNEEIMINQVSSNLERKTKIEMGHMPNLEVLYVDNCELFQQEGDGTRIRHCPAIDGYLFPKLTSLYMRKCNKIRVLLSPSSLTSLECLEKLQVVDCDDMEEIISQEESEGSANQITLPRLQDIDLRRLPNLKAFSQGSYLFSFPSLRKVRIDDCPNMEVFSKGTFHTPKLDDFNMTGPHGRNYIHNCDLNTAVQGFKVFVESHELEMLRWNSKDVLKHFISSVSEMGIAKFHNLLKLFPFKEIHMFQNVRKLTIEECDSLVEVFESEGGMVAKKGFATTHNEIESMESEYLPELRDIRGPNIMTPVSFNKLTSVTIARCENLKSVISHSMARILVQLKELRVRDCDIMEHIVSMEDEIMDNAGSKVKTIFPKLVTLELTMLPKLECVCSRVYGYDIPLFDKEDEGINDKQEVQISFPQLEQLSLGDLPSLKCFCPGAYDYDPMISSYCGEDYTQATTFPKGNVTISTPNLHEVYNDGHRIRTMGDVNLTIHYIQNSDKYKVELQQLETIRCLEHHQYQHLLGYITRIRSLQLKGCDKLSSCVPCNLMPLFKHLTELQVQECGSLEEIFESYEHEVMELREMELHNLPKLKHIWRNPGFTFGFQNLKYLTVRGCHNLKFVLPDVSIFVKGLLNYLYHIEVSECNNMEEIIHHNNNSVQKGAKIIFPSLDKIVLRKLPKLNCFCPSPSSFHFELPQCYDITIEECSEMKTFCHGTLYTPRRPHFYMDGWRFAEENVNEAIQEIRRQ